MVAPTAAAFAQAFGQIPNLPNAVRAQTARQAAQRFSIEAQIDRTLALYESLVKPAGSA
jgi:glycosyltransferase involved in cell wall biosynthesis